MSIRKICFMTLLLLAVGATVMGEQRIITLHYPPDKSVMEFDILNMSLSVPRESADLIKITVNDKEKSAFVPDQEFECFSVLLTTGVNRINISATKENKEVDSIALSVFRRSNLESIYKDPPSGFQKDYFHMKAPVQCAGCHVLEPADTDRKPVDVAAFPADKLKSGATVSAGSTCYSCHKRLTSYPFIHGPAAVWSCLSCHDPQTKPRYSVIKPDTKLCFGCHIRQKEEWYAKKYFHGPFSVGKCAICHSPHASGNPYNLHKPVWDLCTSCHIDEGSGRHIVAAVGGSYFHPTRGRQDPLRKDKELSCASCHDPHASDSPKLWRLNVGSGFELCKKCHTD